MSLGQQLAPHLPFLRRYGRALTGSQMEGDRYVRATLEAIVAAPDEFPREVDPRLGLYRTFQAIWGSTHLDDETVESLVAEALAEIDSQTRARVLIIEDEPLIAMDLETIVRDQGHEVTGVAVTRDEAVALAMDDRPGLVLADIQLADDSSGIDAVKDILAQFNVPVIFITAFPERLLTGERPEPTFLIRIGHSGPFVLARQMRIGFS